MIWPDTSEVHAHGKSSYIIYNFNVAVSCRDVGIYTMLLSHQGGTTGLCLREQEML